MKQIISIIPFALAMISQCWAQEVVARYQSKHGEVKIVNEFDPVEKNPYANVMLGEKLLTSTKNVRTGNSQTYGYYVVSYKLARQKLPVESEDKSIMAYFLLAESAAGCYNQFIILDLSGDKPYVSNRFGYNPGYACLQLKKIKWGEKKTEIYIDGDPLKFIYRPGTSVIQP